MNLTEEQIKKALLKIKEDPHNYKKLPIEYRLNKEITIAAVRAHGWNLAYASLELKNDRQVVLEAVKKNGNELQYASEEIKNLCKQQNPIKILESILLSEKLSSELSVQKPTNNKMKV